MVTIIGQDSGIYWRLTSGRARTGCGSTGLNLCTNQLLTVNCIDPCDVARVVAPLSIVKFVSGNGYAEEQDKTPLLRSGQRKLSPVNSGFMKSHPSGILGFMITKPSVGVYHLIGIN